MLVVLLVAAQAVGLELVLVQIAGVAALALDLGVFAAQRILRVAVVIEGRGLPAALVMAVLAFRAELTLMALLVVILLVAAVTVGLEFLLIQAAGVTTTAFRLGMLAAQRVFRIAVVIEDGAGPVHFGVTALAFRAEQTLVTLLVIVLAVAGDAGGFEARAVQRL